jgi:hypothetical protein
MLLVHLFRAFAAAQSFGSKGADWIGILCFLSLEGILAVNDQLIARLAGS